MLFDNYYTMKYTKYIFFIVLCFFLSTTILSAREGGPAAGYYSSIDGKSGETLKTTLGTLTRHNLTTLYSYGSGTNHTWQAFYITDRNESDNSVIDMYSNVKRYFNTSAPTASVTNCDIEHMFPNSWWGANEGCHEAYCDLHHLVPADYSANRSKSNHGPGMVVDTTFDNGVWVNGKNAAGTSVFCPPDEYKGDFARAFFYVATTYGDTVTWMKEAVPDYMSNTDWREFLTSTSDLLLSWHRQDPVSEKELKRMNEVYQIQGNRNPFIDYPCLAEYIWGTHAGETVDLSSLVCAYADNFTGDGCVSIDDPTITSPTNAIAFGVTAQNVPVTKTVYFKGVNLTAGNLTLSISGTNASLFTLSTNSISQANASSGTEITITYAPTAHGSHTATLTISGCGVSSHTVTLSGSCAAIYTATWMVSGLQHAQTSAAYGLVPAIPDAPHDCDATRVFMGWTAQSTVSSRPEDLFTDEVVVLTADKTYYGVFADKAENASAVADSITYTFSSKSWAASPANWTSGADGTAYSSTNSGVQVSTSKTGANATSPTSFDKVAKVIVNYCTNGGSSAGTIDIQVGETTVTSDQISNNDGGTTLRDTELDFSSTRPSGNVKITVNTTAGSIYINSITITYGTTFSYDDYSLTCGASGGPEVTAYFLNQGDTVGTREGHTGEAISSISTPVACAAYTFSGWSTQTYATHNTAAPTIDYTGVFPTADVTYNAVYSKTVSGGAVAPKGQVMWSEDFSSYVANNVPSGNQNASNNNGRVVYNDGAVTYSCSDGNTSTVTKIYNATNAGGTSPELLVSGGQGYFEISNIPTGNADSLALTFLMNSTAQNSHLLVTSETDGVVVDAFARSGSNVSVNIKTTGVSTFALKIIGNAGSNNIRVDNFSLVVKKAGSAGSGTTTYYTTSPDCDACTPVTPTPSFANATAETTCGGSVTNALNKDNSDGIVTYTSSDTEVASVDETTGAITANGVGTTTITASIAASTCFYAASASYTLMITHRTPTNFHFIGAPTNLQVGHSNTKAVSNAPEGSTVTYSSSNTSIATVDATTGEVTAIAPGTVRITATSSQTSCYASAQAYYDLTITANPTYAVKWHVNGVTKTVIYEKDSLLRLDTVPSNCSDDRVFMCWTAQNGYAADTLPADSFTVVSGTVTSALDFYAVYANKTTTGGDVINKSFTFNITADDFKGGAYSSSNGEHTSVATASDDSTVNVTWTSYQVRKSSGIQWQASAGYIYNNTDLGTITDITITSSAGTYTTYYGTSEQPSESTTVGGGFFKIVVGSETGSASNIAVTFQQSKTTPIITTYSNFTTLCSDCAATVSVSSSDTTKGTVEVE